jgi:hypothetical protein
MVPVVLLVLWSRKRKEFCSHVASAPSLFVHFGMTVPLEKCQAHPVAQFLEPIALEKLSFPIETL